MRNGDSITGIIKTEVIICAALLTGVLTFFGISLVLRQQGIHPKVDESARVLTYFAAGFGVAMLFCGLILPARLASRVVRLRLADTQRNDRAVPPSGTRTPDNLASNEILDAPLAAIHRQKTIIAFAILEGAALFNIIAHLLNGELLSVAVTGVLLLAMALQFPTGDRLRSWIETQKREASAAIWQEGG